MNFKSPKVFVPVGIVILVFIYILWPSAEEVSAMHATAHYGPFRSEVVSTGELTAENSREITGPEGLQRFRIYDIKIDHIIEEGTYVKEGDYIATLDKSELATKINDTELDLEKAESQYTQIKLDTALSMRDARNNIRNLEMQEEQKDLILEQSKYEPPATIKQAKIDLDNSKRATIQAKENYKLKQKQAVAKMREAQSNLQKSRNKLQNLLNLQARFAISAPDEGMLIYRKSWDGSKVKTGSQISTWDPIVATLPDLSVLLSKTFINEVEISRVRKGQMVDISLDAFPDARLKGEVTEVANMGEKRRNDDSKVFEVVIKVTDSDSTYRPGMTTSNHIITDEQDSALLVPIEAVFGDDEHSWVYVKGSSKRTQVKTGSANDVDVVILAGLKEGDDILLNEPDNGRDMKLEELPWLVKRTNTV